ncbi:hypothetical protein [Paenibacillus montanisoli]|uniref:Uncharacterized protein n=1 Tax=Paenibacillus montanisoli TaxID=2081970 RepID=A0A328TX10_9BACL|nr:hypothetical protein [Paenibacillus montanisoli]RAP74222.1 hypothetical protein DL346_24495 [Paenibacillus montanisoli]
MLIVSTFEHTLQLEQALAVLEKKGINKESILVIPMDLYDKNPHELLIRAEDIRVRGFEIGTALATALGVIGASVGFKLKWGPIAWGLIYAFIGMLIGFGAVCLVRMWKGERPIARSPRRPLPEVTVIVHCGEGQSDEIRNIFWQYRAISVGDAMEPASS